MKLLLDFHYSDTWADPAHQRKPAAWVDLHDDDLEKAVHDHTQDVLSAFKRKGRSPTWCRSATKSATECSGRMGRCGRPRSGRRFAAWSRRALPVDSLDLFCFFSDRSPRSGRDYGGQSERHSRSYGKRSVEAAHRLALLERAKCKQRGRRQEPSRPMEPNPQHSVVSDVAGLGNKFSSGLWRQGLRDFRSRR